MYWRVKKEEIATERIKENCSNSVGLHKKISSLENIWGILKMNESEITSEVSKTL
jgi:hypothetical protein